MDISAHPITVIAVTLASLITAAVTVWGALVYIRKRWFGPLIVAIRELHYAAKMVPQIQAQLKTNGGSSLRDAVNQAIMRLSAIEAQNSALMQGYDTGMFRTDREGKTTWVNTTYCRLLGTTTEEAMGWGWKNRIPYEEREEYFREWLSAVADKRGFARIMHALTADSGVEHVFKVQAYPVGEAGEFGYMGFIELLPRPAISLPPPT